MWRLHHPNLAALVAATFFASSAMASGFSEGGNGNAAPNSSIQVGSQDGSGNLRPASSTYPIPVDTGASSTSAAPGAASAKATSVQGVSGMTPLDSNLKQVGGATFTEGQGTKSQSIPVTIASDQGQATASVAINVSSATTTQLVAISGSKSIYVSHYNWISGGTGNVTLEYGTGSTCGTGTTVLTGPYGMLAGGGISAGSGVAPILFVPAGNALCILTSTTAQISGSLAYVQP